MTRSVKDTVDLGSISATAPAQVLDLGALALLMFGFDGSVCAVAVPATRDEDVFFAHFWTLLLLCVCV